MAPHPVGRGALYKQAGLGRAELRITYRSPVGAGIMRGSNAMALQARTRLGPYEVVSRIGVGGMGEVWLATELRLGRKVALKLLPADLTRDPVRIQRFEQEARAASALNHPNVCTIHALEQTSDGQHYIAMEFVDGQTLRQRLTTSRLSVREALDIATQLAAALTVAHAAGIIHRDIKPENVMVRSDGIVKVLDFGLAKLTGASKSAAAEVTQTAFHTDVDSVVGTVAYMSPEQLRGEDLDARTDLFSFGLLLYEMATGRQAFAGSTGTVIAAAILHQQPPAPRTLRPELPEQIEQVILKALEKDRELRYQHAADIRTDLERLKRDSDSAPVRAAATPAPARGRRGRSVAIAVASGAVLLLATVAYFYSQRTPPKLTDKDTIVLADFTNTTGDPVFDGTLRRGLAIQLEQSPFLSLVSESRIQQTLVLMGQPAGARLTPEISREICERTGSAAVLEGSIASLGTQYVLGLQASNCRTGDVLDAEQVQASRKENVLTALSEVATTFRARVGESLATVEKHSTPLPEATTPSFEALKAYSAGLAAESSSGMSAAVPLYRRAVEIDPQFALAWAALGLRYSNLGESRLSIESTTKAYELRYRASDRERFFITMTYDRQVTGNLEKAKETLRSWADTYPRDVDARGMLGGFTSQGAGLFDLSIETSLKAIAVDQNTRLPYVNLAYGYAFLDRFDAAEATIEKAGQRGIDIPEVAMLRFYLAFLKGDAPRMEREAAQTRGKPGAEDWMLHAQALVQARAGRLGLARTLSRRAVDLAQQAGQRERAALYLAGAATWEAFFGNTDAARETATEALGLSNGRDVEYGAGFALASVGDAPRVQALARDLQARFPEDTCARFTYVPTLRALLALNGGDSAKAAELLQPTAPYELAAVGVVFNGFFGGLYPAYVRGEAYQAARKATEAIGEFQKIVTHRGIVLGDPVGALARLQLARSFVRAGDKGKAKNAYQDVFTVWEAADTDVPVIQQAKVEYAALH